MRLRETATSARDISIVFCLGVIYVTALMAKSLFALLVQPVKSRGLSSDGGWDRPTIQG